MYTIMMNADKSLSKTVTTTIFQGEKLVDEVKFLIPQKYGSVNLADLELKLKYMDIGNVLHMETLTRDEALYKDMLCYRLPVNTKITRFAGKISIHLSFVKDGKQILHTGETFIMVEPTSPFYQYSVDNSGGSGDDSGSSTSPDEEGYEVVEF